MAIKGNGRTVAAAITAANREKNNDQRAANQQNTTQLKGSDIKSNLADSEYAMELSQKKLAQANFIASEKRDQAESYRTKLETLRGKLKGQQGQQMVSQLESRYTSAIQNYRLAVQEANTANQAFEASKSQYNQAKKQYDGWKSSLRRGPTTNEIQNLNREKNALEKINSQLGRDMAAVGSFGSTAFQSQIEKNRSRISEIEAQLSGTPQADEERAQAQVQQLTQLIEGLGAVNRQLERDSEAVAVPGRENPLQAQIEANRKRIEELEKERSAAQEEVSAAQEEAEWNDYFRYADLTEAPDFDRLSKYTTTANGKEVKRSGTDSFYETGYDNIIYDYINRDPEAVKLQSSRNLKEDMSYLEQMSDEEISIYNYVYAKDGAQAASEYLDHIRSNLNSRQRSALETKLAERAKESPVAASLTSIALTPVRGASFLGQSAQMLTQGKIDENAGYNAPSYISSAIRDAVSKQAEEKWGPVGSFLYQTGMSMGDFLMSGAMSTGSPALALSIIGSGAAADTTIAAKDRGLNDKQAYTLGAVAGLAEVITEKVSIDALLDKTSLGKSAMGYILKNMAAEGGEEVGSELINLAADVIVAKDKSQWQQSIEAYVAEGYSREQAFAKAVADQAMNMVSAAAGGALSGGVMGAGSVVLNRGRSPEANLQEDTPGDGEQEQTAVPADQPDMKAPATDTPTKPNLLRQTKDQIVSTMSAQLRTVEDDRYLNRLNAATTDLQISGVLTGAEDAQIQSAQRLSDLLGKRILFEPTDKSRNGWYKRSEDTIYLNPQTKNPIAQVIGHELTHSIEVSTADYGKLQQLVTERIQKTGGDFAAMRQQKIDLYAQNNVTISEAQADREVVAEYVEKNLLTDEQAIAEVVRDSRSVARRILDWLDGLLAKIGNKHSQERQFVLQARDAYRKALQESYGIHERSQMQQARMQAYAEGDDAAGDAMFDEQWDQDSMLEDKLGDVEFSIGRTQDDRPFVTVERDILDGVPQDDWTRTVKNNLKERFPQGIQVGRNVININKQSRNELTRSNKTVRMARKDPQGYADKFRATDNADEVLQASTNWINEGLNHGRKDTIREFARGSVLIRVGQNDYDAEVIVGTKEDGTMMLYDIVNMKPTTIAEKKQAQVNTANVQNGLRSSLVPDRNIIAQNTQAVNPEQSQKMTTTTASRDQEAQYSISAEENGDDRPFVTVERLPAKAQSVLKGIERNLKNRVASSLSVPYHAKREFLQPIVREISAEFLRTGAVSQETTDRLFETGYAQGIVVDTEFYDTYKEVKDYLRTTALTLGQSDRADIADFDGFKKRSRYTLKLKDEGGLPVDTAWGELQEMAPALFPKDITHPADQLQHMLDVAQNISKSEKTLEEYYGPEAETFKAWAKNDFEAAVGDSIAQLRQVKRFAEDREAAEEAKVHTDLTQEEVTALYPKLKDARRNYEKVMAKNLLTEEDQKQVSRLLRGDIELQHLKPGKDNVTGIKAVYEAKLEYEKYAQQIRQWNRSRKAQLMAEAAAFTENANSWKDKKMGILYSRETMERNIRDIVPDKDLAERIIDRYIKPVHDGAAQANRTKNRYRDRIRALNLSQKAAKGKASEAYAVQLLGEAEDNIRVMEQSRGRIQHRDGKTIEEWQAVINDLWTENPQLDQAKIRTAVEEFRKIYDELFTQMNEARVRNGYEPVNYRQGYFPHFQAKDEEGIMALFGRALGIKTEVTALPTSINGLTHTFKPGIRWMGNALERKGFETAYDALEGFDRYIEGVADVIHQTDNIQRLRALATQVRYNSTDEGIRNQIDAVRAREDLSDIDKENRIKEIYENARYALSNFVVELEEYTNLLANKKSRADRDMEQALGRDAYNLVKSLESRVAANMVAVNPGSWLTNFIPLTQGSATLDKGLIWQGMWDTLKAYKNDDGFVDMSSFLINRRGSDPLVQTWQQKASAKLSSPMEVIDSFTADSLVRARFKQNVNRGISDAEAITEADQWAAGVMADRSKGATPTLFNRSNPLMKLFTQFQLEVNNQLSYVFKDIPREAADRDKYLAALALMLFKFAIGAFFYNEAYEYVIGRRPALDPLGILNDTVGDITGFELPNMVEYITGEDRSLQTEQVGGHEAVGNLATNVLEELPFVGSLMGGGRLPISSALPDWENLSKAAFNDEWSPEKRLATAASELGNPLTYLAMPFGGGQVKKIWQGAKAVLEGGSYTVDSEGNELLQYPVYSDNPLEWAMNAGRAMLFGKSSLPTGADWIESGFKNLSAPATAAYKDMLEAGVSGEDAYELVRDITGAKKTGAKSAEAVKRDILRSSGVPDEGKAIVYYALMANEKERALMDALEESGVEPGSIVDSLMDIREGETKNDQLSVLMKSGLDQEAFEKVVGHIMGTELTTDKGNSTQYSDYLESVDRGLEPEEALQMQTDGIDLEKFLQYTDAGLSVDLAAKLVKELHQMKQEKGKDRVTDLQKWKAACNVSTDTKDQMAALEVVMDETVYQKLSIGYEYGVDPAAYIHLKEILPQYDANGSGSYSHDEIEAAINAMSASGLVLPGGDGTLFYLTVAQKAALWQIWSTSNSAKNNPYDADVGWAVIEAKKAE